MPVAIISGASSGLGREFVYAVLEMCPEIDEFWLISRKKERLDALNFSNKSISVIPIPMDLGIYKNLSVLKRVFDEQKPDVRVVINCAGFGDLGDVIEGDWEKYKKMVDLNSTAPVAICTMALPYMSDGGLIINVSAFTSFGPAPGMAVYGATKSFVTSFSKALSAEVKPRGITVLSACPGRMKTNFTHVAKIEQDQTTRYLSFPEEKTQKFAYGALEAALKGKHEYVGNWYYKFLKTLSKVLPSSVYMKFTDL